MRPAEQSISPELHGIRAPRARSRRKGNIIRKVKMFFTARRGKCVRVKEEAAAADEKNAKALEEDPRDL